MKINSEALIHALEHAIRDRQDREKELGYTFDSIMLATWKAARDQLARGEKLEVLYL